MSDGGRAFCGVGTRAASCRHFVVRRPVPWTGERARLPSRSGEVDPPLRLATPQPGEVDFEYLGTDPDVAGSSIDPTS
jgi:hypothetical protein